MYKFIIQQSMKNFEVLQKIGEGSFASVYKVNRLQDGQTYAMKKIKISQASPRQLAKCLNEVRILASISNPYILSYKEAVYQSSQKSLLLITELAEGGDLKEYIKSQQKKKQRIDQIQIWRMAIQLLHGIKVLHKMNIFHRDIKSANIFLSKDQKQIRIGDLNISIVSKSGLAITQTGTPFYASPEVWSGLPYTGKCDIWSIGCVLYEMATFRPPFLGNQLQTLQKNIMKGKLDPIPSLYSQDLAEFIRLCLTKNPRQRLDVDQLLGTKLIRRKLFLFPNDKFNEIGYEHIFNKQNCLLETIRLSKKRNFGDQLNICLPKSNYQNLSEVIMKSERKRSFMQKNDIPKLPQIIRRKSSLTKITEKKMTPKSRMLYLR